MGFGAWKGESSGSLFSRISFRVLVGEAVIPNVSSASGDDDRQEYEAFVVGI